MDENPIRCSTLFRQLGYPPQLAIPLRILKTNNQADLFSLLSKIFLIRGAAESSINHQRAEYLLGLQILQELIAGDPINNCYPRYSPEDDRYVSTIPS